MKKLHLLALILAAAATTISCKQGDAEELRRDFKQELNEFMEENPYIANAVALVASPSEGFVWTKAEGYADIESGEPMSVDHPIHIASIGKMFTSLAICLLEKEGKLDFDDPISGFLPPDLVAGLNTYDGIDRSAEVTIRHLMNHRSGIADYSEGELSEASEEERNIGDKMILFPETTYSVIELIEFAKENMDSYSEPGEKGRYSDTNYLLLGLIIESVSKDSYESVIRKRIFEPLGMNSSYLRRVGLEDPEIGGHSLAHIYAIAEDESGLIDITGFESFKSCWSDGSFASSIKDMYVFMRASVGNEFELSEETLRAMRDWSPLKDDHEGMEYGLGLMHWDFAESLGPDSGLPLGFPDFWGHSGVTGAFSYYCESLDLYIIGTANTLPFYEGPFDLIVNVLLKEMGERN